MYLKYRDRAKATVLPLLAFLYSSWALGQSSGSFETVEAWARAFHWHCPSLDATLNTLLSVYLGRISNIPLQLRSLKDRPYPVISSISLWQVSRDTDSKLLGVYIILPQELSDPPYLVLSDRLLFLPFKVFHCWHSAIECSASVAIENQCSFKSTIPKYISDHNRSY